MRGLASLAIALLLLAHPAMAAEIVLAIETVEIGHDPFTAQPTVEIVLMPEARKTVAKLTLEHIGDVIELRIDGELVTAPVVRSPILDGVLVIAGSMTEADARLLVARLGENTARITVTPVARQ